MPNQFSRSSTLLFWRDRFRFLECSHPMYNYAKLLLPVRGEVLPPRTSGKSNWFLPSCGCLKWLKSLNWVSLTNIASFNGLSLLWMLESFILVISNKNSIRFRKGKKV